MINSNFISGLVLFLGMLSYPNNSYTQLKIHQFEEIEDLNKMEQRDLVVFVHTDWCRYCKAMKNTTFKNEEVVEKLNDQFYFVSLNAEEQRSITFAERSFRYKPTGANTGIHELAEAMGTIDGKLSFPTLVILNPKNEIIFQFDGFINDKNLVQLLSQLALTKN